jgi:AcrR family transcriptional regulator
MERTRAAIQAEATRLFLAKGFEATTVEEIAAGAGISPRTFFRYFASKEDVVLDLVWLEVDRLAERIASRPADEGLLASLEGALSETTARSDGLERELLVLLKRTPSLRARWLAQGWESAQRLRPVVAARLGLPVTELKVALAANTLFAVAETVLDAWAGEGGLFTERMREALRAVDGGGLFGGAQPASRTQAERR